MHTFLFRVSALSLSLLSLQTFGASEKYSQKFRDQPPVFYAALAEAAYESNCVKVQELLDKRLGAGKATVLDHCDFENKVFGHTNIILVKDDRNRLHVSFEGSSEGRNWVGNICMALRGTVCTYAVPHGIRKKMHRIIKGWERWQPGSTLVSISGHSQGGLYASEIARSHHQHYTKPLRDKKTKEIDRSKRQGRTNVITFNAFMPIKKGNQYHFRTKHEYASSLFSPSDYYIDIKESGNPASIAANHGLKYARRGLKGKDWSDYID